MIPTDDVLVSDGGLATHLEAMGHDLSDSLWSARLLRDDPAAIVEAHLSFLRAGAQIVTTASYQASFDGFAAAGIGSDEVERLMRRSVSLAREAVDRHDAESGERARIAVSVGPYGAALADGSEYRGRHGLTVAELRTWHRRRFEVLAGEVADGRADLLAVETVPDADEATALVGLVTRAGVDAWLSYTIDGLGTRAGQPLEEAFAVTAGAPSLVAVGVNCCAPGDVLPAVRTARAVTGLPVVVYPNSGEGWDAAARSWTGEGESIAAVAPAWAEAGAGIVGGCCRVGPAEIAVVRSALTPATTTPQP